MTRPTATVDTIDPALLADVDLFALARRSPHDRLGVALGHEELEARTALTAGGVGTGNEFILSAQAVLPGISTAVAPMTAATPVVPGRAATLAAWNMATRPAGEVLAEGATYTPATATLVTSGQLSPLHIMACQGYSRQWLKQAGGDDVVWRECWAAVWRVVETLLGRAYLDDGRITATSTALSATTFTNVVSSVLREVPAPEVRVTTSPMGSRALVALEAATFRADWRAVGGIPHVTSPGVSETEDSNKTAVMIGSPRAAALATWGAYTIEDPYTLKKRGQVELVAGVFIRPLIVRPFAVQRIDGVTAA